MPHLCYPCRMLYAGIILVTVLGAGLLAYVVIWRDAPWWVAAIIVAMIAGSLILMTWRRL